MITIYRPVDISVANAILILILMGHLCYEQYDNHAYG